MKKVLILAYDFPPYVSVGGLRPYSWYKYFKEFGIYPIVVTRQWGNNYGNYLDYLAKGESDDLVIEETEYGIIIKTPYKPNLSNRLLLKYGDKRFGFIRKLITAFYEFAQWIWIIGPKAELFKGAREYLKMNNVDFIIATGDPFILFNYASMLSKNFNIPWIADYRDPWTQGKHHSRNFMMKHWNMFFERKTLANVLKIITVSDFVKGQIMKLVKNKDFCVIPNGYDSALVRSFKTTDQESKILTIGFMGTVYDWHPMKSILNVFSDIANKGFVFRIEFYGLNIEKRIQEWIVKDFPVLKNNVLISPRIPNEELLRKMSKNNAFLLLNYYSFMGTKIFDYLGLKRKIIFCYSNDDESKFLKEKYYTIEENDTCSKTLQEDLIKETNSGIIVKDKEHLKEVLINLHEEFKDKGLILCDSVGVEKYSRREQVGFLVKVFN